MQRWQKTVLLSATVGAVVGITAFTLPNIRIQHVETAARGVQQQEEAATGVNAQEQQPVAAETEPRTTEGNSMSSASPLWAALIGKLAWPLSLLIALAMIGWNSRLRRIFGTGSRFVRKVSAGGVSMEISADAVDEVRDQLRGSFRELVANARDEFERMADLQNLDDQLEVVIEKTLLPAIASKRKPDNLRATIHVRDVVFRDYLYQLIDYYPRGGGAHRRFSQRYGIIGRSWRSGKSHGTGNAFGSSPSAETLVEEWGMTREETHGVLNEKPSCLSIILRADDVAVGILYVDSSEKNAFGDSETAQKLALALEDMPACKKLAAAVERALTPLRIGGPNLDIKELG